MRSKSSFSLAIAAVALLGVSVSTPSQAFPLTLTPAGIADGFTLNSVISGLNGNNPGCCFVLGSAVNSAGQIVLNDASTGVNYLINNANNQVGVAATLSSVANPGFPTAIVNAGGTLYASGGALRRLTNSGATDPTFNSNGITVSAGMWTNTVNQHIIAVGSFGGGSGLLDIDVSGALPTARLINNASSDGVTVSPDGTIVYTNNAAYRISDGGLVASYSVAGADGMGVIQSNNALNGNLIISTAFNGTLVMLEPGNNFLQTVIASGGGYGDFTSPDFTTGTLLISSGDSLLRLGCGVGCGVGAPPVDPGVPEPQSLLLVMAGLMGFFWSRRRR